MCGVALSLIIGPRSLCVSLCRVSVSPSSACLIECVICFLISTLFSTLFFYDDECSFVFSRLRFSTVCVVIENISTRLYSLCLPPTVRDRGHLRNRPNEAPQTTTFIHHLSSTLLPLFILSFGCVQRNIYYPPFILHLASRRVGKENVDRCRVNNSR